jgi:hypothetical protein
MKVIVTVFMQWRTKYNKYVIDIHTGIYNYIHGATPFFFLSYFLLHIHDVKCFTHHYPLS